MDMGTRTSPPTHPHTHTQHTHTHTHTHNTGTSVPSEKLLKLIFIFQIIGLYSFQYNIYGTIENTRRNAEADNLHGLVESLLFDGIWQQFEFTTDICCSSQSSPAVVQVRCDTGMDIESKPVWVKFKKTLHSSHFYI